MNPWKPDFEPRSEAAVLSGDGGRQPSEDGGPRAAAAYGAAVKAVRHCLLRPEDLDQDCLTAVSRAVEDLLRETLADNQELLALATRSTPGNYLYGHSVNVCVLALRLGVALGWGKEKLTRLGLAALMHDIGMTPWLKLVLSGRRLSGGEARDLQLHVTESARLLQRAQNAPDSDWEKAVEVILHETERKGRAVEDPAAWQGASEVRTASHILGVCDAYEALTHPRSFRRALTPHAAIRRLLRLDDPTIDRAAVRLLVSRVTLFPPGSYVRLSAGGEIGLVTRVHPTHPTRPQVLVLMDRRGESLTMPRSVNLAAQTLDHVDEAVDAAALDIPDRRLMAILAANRWWLD